MPAAVTCSVKCGPHYRLSPQQSPAALELLPRAQAAAGELRATRCRSPPFLARTTQARNPSPSSACPQSTTRCRSCGRPDAGALPLRRQLLCPARSRCLPPLSAAPTPWPPPGAPGLLCFPQWALSPRIPRALVPYIACHHLGPPLQAAPPQAPSSFDPNPTKIKRKAAEGAEINPTSAPPLSLSSKQSQPLRLARGGGGGRRHRPSVTIEKAFQMKGVGGGGGKMRGAAGLMGLQKQNSWSPDIERDEAWERRRRGLLRRGPSSSALSRAQSVTDDDLDELRGCLDLGFGFEPTAAGCAACGEGRTRLVETLPALDLYYAVAVKGGSGSPEGCASPCTCGGSSEASDPSPIGSPLSILSPDDPPETVKMRTVLTNAPGRVEQETAMQRTFVHVCADSGPGLTETSSTEN